MEVLTAVSEVYKVKDAFEKVGMHPVSTGFSFVAKTSVPVGSKDGAEKLLELIESIEDHDDVQRVHSNMEIDDKVAAQLSGR